MKTKNFSIKDATSLIWLGVVAFIGYLAYKFFGGGTDGKSSVDKLTDSVTNVVDSASNTLDEVSETINSALGVTYKENWYQERLKAHNKKYDALIKKSGKRLISDSQIKIMAKNIHQAYYYALHTDEETALKNLLSPNIPNNVFDFIYDKENGYLTNVVVDRYLLYPADLYTLVKYFGLALGEKDKETLDLWEKSLLKMPEYKSILNKIRFGFRTSSKNLYTQLVKSNGNETKAIQSVKYKSDMEKINNNWF